MSDRRTALDLIGGAETCRQLSAAFYARVARDPILRPLFPGKSMRCAIEEFGAFLVQFLGGPAEQTQYRWWVSLRESHQRFRIGAREREAWMRNMTATVHEAPLPEDARTALLRFFETSSAYVVNSGPAPSPDRSALHPEIARCWSAQLAIDRVIEAVRARDSVSAIELVADPPLRAHLEAHAAIFASILAEMIAAAHPALLAFVREELLALPALAHVRYSRGRTLLHCAAANGNLPLVDLLLHLGTPVDVADSGGHTPLYVVANESRGEGGSSVVRRLVAAGAAVDTAGGVTRCTPLHMAARRGNVEVAAALIECGADVCARDARGVTPLSRALKCRKKEVAELLSSGPY